MDKTQYIDTYTEQLAKLKTIIETANSRIVSDDPDSFFQDNVNFFSKSFLVLMCVYLESYLKDVFMVVVDEANRKLELHNLPYNLIKWSLDTKKDFKDGKFEDFKIRVKKKDLDDFISGNPYRTKDLCVKFGINLEDDSIYNIQKEAINSIIRKRNNVIHYNDDASDVSNADLLTYLDSISNYISNIDKIICNNVFSPPIKNTKIWQQQQEETL